MFNEQEIELLLEMVGDSMNRNQLGPGNFFAVKSQNLAGQLQRLERKLFDMQDDLASNNK